MGWANCGEDSKGRSIGYAHGGTCDQPGCEREIDRGLSYACGDMHGLNEGDCEGYFCEEHRTYETLEYGARAVSLCLSCARLARASRLHEFAGDLHEEGPVGGFSTETCDEAAEDIIALLEQNEALRNLCVRALELAEDIEYPPFGGDIGKNELRAATIEALKQELEDS